MTSLKKLEHLGSSETPFPSITINEAGDVVAQGEFARRMAEFMSPLPRSVEDLAGQLRAKNVGVVAHFYMDSSIQGLLTSAQALWKHIFIADSLAMGDAALKMCQAGVDTILCLGVDFMSENVRAILDANGFPQIPVYRLATEQIGCSLSYAAEQPSYYQYLRDAVASGQRDRVPVTSVVYINTSLLTKAKSQEIIPTVTCTSSNVVKTILQLTAQIPTLRVYYGPDSYMGNNLIKLFSSMAANFTEEQIRALHPAHSKATVARVASSLQYYQKGYCLVHHIFGSDVVRRIKEQYVQGRPEDDAFVTAHLEVPGEMFQLAVKAQAEGRGVVGATSDILNFITTTVETAIKHPTQHPRHHLRFLLGTESGMTTSIVRKIQALLKANPGNGLAVEIIFPVSSQAIAQTGDIEMPVVPGVCGGEGCSQAGGCASCPFMKMNTLQALFSVLSKVGTKEEGDLAGFKPRQYTELIQGKPAALLGSVPILEMRHFQAHKEFSQEFILDVLTRSAKQ